MRFRHRKKAPITTGSARKNGGLDALSIDNIVVQLELKSELKKSRRETYKHVVSSLPVTENTIRKDDKELREQKIKEHVEDMIENSSLHGFSYIFDKRYSIRRIVWLIFTIAAFCYAMQKVYESTVNYFNYPSNSVRMRQYVDKIKFPAVSFCNINDMRMSILNGTEVDEAIVLQKDDVSADKYRNTTRNAAHKLEEMLIACEFDGVKCSANNFSTFNWMQGDRCFTFNSGKPGHKSISVSGTGVKRGLTLTINVQHYDYYRDVRYSGIHLILHGQDETPVRIRGPILSPGYTTYIQLEKKKVCFLKNQFIFYKKLRLIAFLCTIPEFNCYF